MELSDDSGSESGDDLQRQLKKKLAKDNTYGGGRRQKKREGALDDDSDIDRDGNGSEDDDWNNYKTGGPIQLDKGDGSKTPDTTGKVIPNRRNFGKKNWFDFDICHKALLLFILSARVCTEYGFITFE